MHWTEARDILKKWREDNHRNSVDVVGYWEDFLKSKSSKLGDEYYLILEQVCIAAFDCYRLDVAEDCLQELSSYFPNSLRVLLLQVIHLEVLDRYDDALELLDNMIKKDETNASPRKRKIAILKARGRIQDAIKELSEYLKKFMIDQEAWQELCDLYLMEQEYAKAAFCMEELILHNPHNHLFHQRLAEIRYTQGGYENMELAKAYYSQALKLNPNNMRALFGLYLVCTSIASSNKSVSSKKKDASNMCLSLMKRIMDKYEVASAGEEEISYLETLMKSTHITASS